jgi:hypothetical protein
MESLVGTWRLVGEEAWDSAGERRAPLMGARPMGLATFNAEGRMMAVLSDGSAETAGKRAYVSYCGAYTFDGARLVTQVDGASEARFWEAAQVREASFADGILTLRPPPRVFDGVELRRALHWEKIG